MRQEEDSSRGYVYMLQEEDEAGEEEGSRGTCDMYICRTHFLKLRSSVQM